MLICFNNIWTFLSEQWRAITLHDIEDQNNHNNLHFDFVYLHKKPFLEIPYVNKPMKNFLASIFPFGYNWCIDTESVRGKITNIIGQTHSGPENLKKSRQINSRNQINQIFSWNCISGSFKLFPSSKIDFWPFLKFAINKFFVKLIFLISQVFLPWPFLIFWPTVRQKSNCIAYYFGNIFSTSGARGNLSANQCCRTRNKLVSNIVDKTIIDAW